MSSKPEGDQGRAILLIRAMIAAANADGDMDAQERKRIAQKLRAIEPSEEEKRFLARELKSPAALPEIAAQVDSRQLALQVYAVSRLTIDPDTRAERGYLERLARALDLDARAIQSMEAKLGPLVTAGRSATKGE